MGARRELVRTRDLACRQVRHRRERTDIARRRPRIARQRGDCACDERIGGAELAYSDARMGLANAMAYFSILLSILFTVYFYRKLAAARTQIAAEW